MKVNPQAPDAIIVIFGAAVRPDGKPSQTLRHRVEAAARFGKRFARPLFIPTGGQGRFGDAEAAVMTRLLREAGFSEASILQREHRHRHAVLRARRRTAGARPVAGLRLHQRLSSAAMPHSAAARRDRGAPVPAADGAGGDQPMAALVLAPARDPGAAL